MTEVIHLVSVEAFRTRVAPIVEIINPAYSKMDEMIDKVLLLLKEDTGPKTEDEKRLEDIYAESLREISALSHRLADGFGAEIKWDKKTHEYRGEFMKALTTLKDVKTTLFSRQLPYKTWEEVRDGAQGYMRAVERDFAELRTIVEKHIERMNTPEAPRYKFLAQSSRRDELQAFLKDVQALYGEFNVLYDVNDYLVVADVTAVDAIMPPNIQVPHRMFDAISSWEITGWKSRFVMTYHSIVRRYTNLT